ncbi:DUF7667 family protein [Ferviditalea candida]|uniref:Uncharacterized protein n=1 Tax=Ferviditalea candida TaxID=3108399 RepID=A0ABU5ZKJ9_9BACL|nr:hypothetical protein [Paenibacillaceae bacterium T2]
MIAIHPVHRRLDELQIKVDRLGGYHKLSLDEQRELAQCLKVNADIVRKLDELKQLSFIAHVAGDVDWGLELASRIEEIEVKMI